MARGHPAFAELDFVSATSQSLPFCEFSLQRIDCRKFIVCKLKMKITEQSGKNDRLNLPSLNGLNRLKLCRRQLQKEGERMNANTEL